jgi:small subunit ribosomal protein S1
MADSGHVWEGQVVGYNKGGVVVPVGEIRGFVPASQVPGFPRGLNQEERLERLATLVGENLMLKVIEINRRKRRLILSASAAQRQWRKQHRERLLKELREGEVRRGRVSSLCSFGAFVDLGGADGLVHLSELSWRRVRHPKEVVSVGDELEVYVLRLDTERKRIGLSLKRLQPEPWALVEDRYELGQLIEGVVTNVVDFGAFAEIEEGIEGLIHISELTDGSISHAREVVKKGDLLLLRIIRIDARRKRLGLSLKRVLESEWAEWAARLAVEDRGEPGMLGEEPQPPEDQELEVPATLEPEESPEAAVSVPVAAEATQDTVVAEEPDSDGEPETAGPDVEEEPAALAESEEPVEVAVSEPIEAEVAEDMIGAEVLDIEAETEVAEPDGVEEPAALAEPKEPLESAVSEPVEAGVAEDTIGAEAPDSEAEPEAAEPDGAEEPQALAEPEELESVGTEDSQSPESGEAEELEIVVREQSEDVEETPDGSYTGVEEAEAAEALAVEDPELAATEA